MTPEVETIVREHMRALDRAQEPVTWSEIAAHVDVRVPDAARPTTPHVRRSTADDARPMAYGRSRWAAAGVAAVILALVVGPILLLDTGGNSPSDGGPGPASSVVTPSRTAAPGSALAISEDFMAAWVAGDSDTLSQLLGPEGSFGAFQSSELAALHDWYQELGWTFQDRGCFPHASNLTEFDGYVSCLYEFEHDVTRALDWGPLVDRVWIRTEQGRIVEAEFGFVHVAGESELFTRFVSWVRERHGEEAYRAIARFSARIPRIDEASIALWRAYTDEFIASAAELDRLAQRYPEADARAQVAETCAAATKELLGSVGMAPLAADREANTSWYEAAADISESAAAEILSRLSATASFDLLDRFATDSALFVEVLRDTAAALRAGEDTAALDRAYLDVRHRIDGYMYACPIDSPG